MAEENANRNTRVGFLVVVVLCIAVAILSNYTYIERKELHTLTQCKARCKVKSASYGKALKEKDKQISSLLDMLKRLDELNDCNEVKRELAKLKGKMEEQEKTALSYDAYFEKKDRKINGLVEDVSSLLVKLEGCRKDKEALYEKYSACDDKLKKTWF